MSQVGIVTDSTNCLPPELIREHDIRVGPVVLIINGKSYLDQVEITPAEFYRLFPTLDELPTTSGVPPAEFVARFEELAKVTDSIACIVLAKDLSVTWQSAIQARDIFLKEHPDVQLEVLDTRTAAGAVGLIVLEAARAARAGKPLAEVVRAATDVMPKVNFVATLETLKYLIKGGRAPKTASVVNLMHLKPIIGLIGCPGKVQQMGLAPGRRKSFVRLVDYGQKILGYRASASRGGASLRGHRGGRGTQADAGLAVGLCRGPRVRNHAGDDLPHRPDDRVGLLCRVSRSRLTVSAVPV